eukprot:9128448-Alexandrium_andersonii.AAC.1
MSLRPCPARRGRTVRRRTPRSGSCSPRWAALPSPRPIAAGRRACGVARWLAGPAAQRPQAGPQPRRAGR